MFEGVSTLNAFTNKTLKEFPFKTQRYLVHKSIVNEIYDWGIATDINGIYLVEKSLDRGTLCCAFAFKTEAELGIFNLTFHSRLLEDQMTTSVFRLTRMLEQVEAATGKKISEI